ncbi:MAG: ethylbenzene dehydrogenase-related protein [Sulfolobales archaeon]
MAEGDSRDRRRFLLFLAIGASVIGAIASGLHFLSRIAPRPIQRTPVATPTTATPTIQTPAQIAIPTPHIVVKRVDKAPIDPTSNLWSLSREYNVELVGQTMTYPLNPTPAVNSVRVRALHDGEYIAFRLEWLDREANVDVLDINRFADQCAVMLLPYGIPGEELSRAWQMGSKSYPATILNWRADWQADVDKGRMEIEDLYPNIAIDGYPPYSGTIANEGKPARLSEMPQEALKWLAGLRAGNIMSEPKRASPVAKLVGRGPGTITPFRTQDASGKGVWVNGVWSVVLAKPLRASDKDLGEIDLRPGDLFYIAFAIWEGGRGERGGRKAISDLLLAKLEG